MENKALLWWLGVTVLATMLMAATLILYFGRGFQPSYKLYVTCDKAPNVTPETPIKRNGVLIGRVEEVETLDEGGVELTLRINKGVRLFSDEVASIGMTSILGESVIEFVQGRGKRERNLLEDESRLGNDSVEVMLGPMDIMQQVIKIMDGFDVLNQAFVDAGNSVKETSDTIGDLVKAIEIGLGDDPNQIVKSFLEKIDSITEKANSTLATYDSLGKDLRAITSDVETQDSLKEVIKNIPSVLTKANTMLDNAEGAITEFRQVGQNANARLDEIGGLTKSLADEKFVDSLKNSLDGIGQFLTNIKDSKGTLGLLLNDPGVYNRLNNSLRKVEAITFQLEPILDDVRVFTSKIATDPRQLGVKGALERTPGGTGTKGTMLGRQKYSTGDYFGREVYYE